MKLESNRPSSCSHSNGVSCPEFNKLNCSRSSSPTFRSIFRSSDCKMVGERNGHGSSRQGNGSQRKRASKRHVTHQESDRERSIAPGSLLPRLHGKVEPVGNCSRSKLQSLEISTASDRTNTRVYTYISQIYATLRMRLELMCVITAHSLVTHVPVSHILGWNPSVGHTI